MIRTIIILIALTTSSNFIAQDHESDEVDELAEHEESYKKNIVSIAFGYAWIKEASNDINTTGSSNVVVPSLGVDYFRRIHHQWEIGIVADLEFGEYLIIHEDLNRENALLIAAMISYEPIKHLSILVGGGIEFEQNEDLMVFRTGIEFPVEISENWLIIPTIMYDFKEGYNTLSGAVGIGMRF